MNRPNIISHLLITIGILGAVAAMSAYGLAVNFVADSISPGTTTTTVYSATLERCELFDGEVAANLLDAGYSLEYVPSNIGSGSWFMDGEYLGSADSEDALFTACAPADLAEAIIEAQP
jgi:hypothetical protein